MKRITSFVLLYLIIILCSPSVLMATSISSYNDEVEIQNKITKIESQKSNLEDQLKNLQKDLNKALKEVEKNQDDPSSKKYIKASNKVNELNIEIQAITNQINSLNYLLESISKNQPEPTEDVISETVYGEYDEISSDIFEISETEEDPITSENLTEAESSVSSELNEIVDSNATTNSDQPEENIDGTNKSSLKDNKPKTFKDYLYASLVALFFLGIILYSLCTAIFSFRCPKCGKWFTMKYIQGSKTYDEYGKRVFKKTYQCSECGYKKTKLTDIPKK